jgi:hypothetical protein
MKRSEMQPPERFQEGEVSNQSDTRREDITYGRLTENEIKIARKVWAKAGHLAKLWGNLVLMSYEGRLLEIEELEKELEKLRRQ